jgi:hypothetical protein
MVEDLPAAAERSPTVSALQLYDGISFVICSKKKGFNRERSHRPQKKFVLYQAEILQKQQSTVYNPKPSVHLCFLVKKKKVYWLIVDKPHVRAGSFRSQLQQDEADGDIQLIQSADFFPGFGA